MIYKTLLSLLVIFLFNSCYAQKKIKPDLYLYFQTDTSKRIYKTSIESKAIISNNKIESSGYNYDIYHYSYISVDGKTKWIYQLFSTVNHNKYCVVDNSVFRKHKILPYNKLEKIRGLISDQWDNKNFDYSKVFIIEKISENQFKIVQVQLYSPFSSEGVKRIRL